MVRVYFYQSWRRRYSAKSLALIRISFRLTLLVEMPRCVCCVALLLMPDLFPSLFPPLSFSFSASSLTGWSTSLINTNTYKFTRVTFNLLELPPCKLFLIIVSRPESTPTSKTESNGSDSCLVNWDLRILKWLPKRRGHFVFKLYFLKVS